ncbi:hypothetical protein IU450_38950 [Nocardia abscessus]|uniref:hypothetical protein n=1 Tax=Nocardia abscessus TaxID=120957 RepID=UPI00189625C3|nr:hypothetical protein [Nocardia abscessus]MBF6341817.1 hypothetical protein [Nocardia abscessus]
MSISLGDAVAVGGLLLVFVLVWAAVFSSDSNRREAAQRVLAMLWRHKHIPTASSRPLEQRAVSPARRRTRHRGGRA